MDAEPDVDQLLAEILDLPESGWRQAVDAACTRHPELGPTVRRRFACLERIGLAAPPAARLPAPGTRFGSYTVLDVLGTGAMGVVYRARRDDLDPEVALKVLRPEYAAHPVARARFVREAAAAARVDHPAVATLHEHGEHEGLPFLALRHVRGPTLAACIAHARRSADVRDELPGGAAAAPSVPAALRRLVGLFAQLADGLHAVHENNLVHRDVKPENVVLEGGERPVLIDFGLAYDPDVARLTHGDDPVGTPAYMAPEQVRGEPADARTDVHALAATLWECATLRPCFEVAGRDALYRAVLQQEVADARTVNRDVPRELAVVLQQALQKDPARRYATMRAFGDDLRRIVAGEPVTARPVPLHRRGARWVRRHPRRVAAIAACAVAAGVVAVVVNETGRRERAETIALAASSGALQLRDPTLATLVAIGAHRELPDHETTRSNLLLALARNLQVGELHVGGLVGCLATSHDEALSVVGAEGWWLVDGDGVRALARPTRGGGRDLRSCSAAAFARDDRSFVVADSEGGLARFARDGSPLALAASDFAGTWWSAQIFRPMPLVDATADGGFAVGDKAGGLFVFDAGGALRGAATTTAGHGVLLLAAHGTRDEVVTVDAAGRVLRWQPPWNDPVVLHDIGRTAVSAARSADGRVLAVGDAGGDVTVLQLATGAAARHTVFAAEAPARPSLRQVGFVALDDAGERLFASDLDHRVALLRLGAAPEVVHASREDATVRCAAFVGSRLVFGAQNGRLTVVDGRGRVERSFAAHQDVITGLRRTHSGQVVSFGWDGTVRRWRLDVPGLPVLAAHDHAAFRVDWLADGDHLVSSGGDGRLRLCSARDGPGARVEVPGDGHLLFALAVDRERRRVASGVAGARDSMVHTWTIDPTGAFVHEHECEVPGHKRWLVWNGGRLLAALGRRVCSIDPAELESAISFRRPGGEPAHDWDVVSIAVDSAGTLVATASVDGTARLWRRDGAWIADLAAGGAAVWSLDVTADGQHVLVGCNDGALGLRDLRGRLVASFAGVRGRVTCARVSPDGTLVAATSTDGHLYVWRRDGTPWLRLPHDSLLLHGVAFAPDGERVAVACSDGTLRIWPVTARGIEALREQALVGILAFRQGR